MADIADRAGDDIEAELERGIAAARCDIPLGVEGICNMCGEWFGRLVGGACAPCRDRRGLD